MDKLREEFEKWFMMKYDVTADAMKIMYFKVEIAWEAWQASRSSIVVDFDEPDSYMTAEATRQAYKAYIRSIGLSIKGE
ncbi:hypothetical protein I5Q96_11270 [Serratia marcescens]|nr:hypothetical protein [Serratia marcescens]MBH3041582.1 hypothetical protein [Serratia marcescens]